MLEKKKQKNLFKTAAEEYTLWRSSIVAKRDNEYKLNYTIQEIILKIIKVD